MGEVTQQARATVKPTKGSVVNVPVKKYLRSGLIIASGLAGVLSGTELAAAQIADDPPGSAFQTQGIREYDGLRPTPSLFSRTARAAAAPSASRAYAYIPVPNGRNRVERQGLRAWATSQRQLGVPAQRRAGRSEWTRCQSLSSRSACPFDIYD